MRFKTDAFGVVETYSVAVLATPLMAGALAGLLDTICNAMLPGQIKVEAEKDETWKPN